MFSITSIIHFSQHKSMITLQNQYIIGILLALKIENTKKEPKNNHEFMTLTQQRTRNVKKCNTTRCHVVFFY